MSTGPEMYPNHSIVFVTQTPMRRNPANGDLELIHDTEDAKRFGTVEVLCAGGLPVNDTAPMVAELVEKLRHYQPNDYLLCLGDPAVIAAAAAIACSRSGGVLRLLVWDKHHGPGYRPVLLEIPPPTQPFTGLHITAQPTNAPRSVTLPASLQDVTPLWPII